MFKFTEQVVPTEAANSQWYVRRYEFPGLVLEHDGAIIKFLIKRDGDWFIARWRKESLVVSRIKLKNMENK